MKNNCIHKVSIIVPAYNTEQYIETCLNSLVRQSYKNIEIIIADDGSTDSTGGICDTYQQRYESLIKVEHHSHRGVSYARLSGIRRATGKYVVFVDADDWVENDYIWSMLLSMKEADIITAGISRELLNEKGSALCEYNGVSAGEYTTDAERTELYGKMLYCGEPYRFGVLPYICNKMFRKDLIQPLLEKIDKRIFDGEDAAVVYPYLLLSHKIILIDECKYHYVNHSNSASMKDTKEAYLNASYLYQALYSCFEKSEHREVLLGQLDLYMRRIIWKKDPAAYLQVNSFLFPYGRVKPGSRIILYGMGKTGDAFYQQINQTGYCRVIAWADRDCGKISGMIETIPGIHPDEISKYCYDYIVIAIQNRGTAGKVLEYLVSMGIDEKKIIVSDV